MSYIKLVNGEPVPMNEDEVAARKAEESAWAVKVQQEKLVEYKKLRAVEYPPVGDQLDAIWKQLNYQRMEGNQLVQEADDILNAILSVKARIKKPGE